MTSKTQQSDIDRALQGLLNPVVHTSHPKADEVIRRLWTEVRQLRALATQQADEAAHKVIHWPTATVDTLAQEIRRVDGNHSLGAGALAEALMPFIAALAVRQDAPGEVVARVTATDILREWFGGERYARDYEYLDANHSKQADRVVTYLAALSAQAEPTQVAVKRIGQLTNAAGEVFWSDECENPVKAIDFALDHCDDHWDRLEFLKSWREGDIAPWPDFLDHIASPEPKP